MHPSRPAPVVRTSTRALWVTAAAAVGLALAPASGIGASATRSCGDVGGEGYIPLDVTVQGDTCRAARKVARKVMLVTDAPWRGCTTMDGSRVVLTAPCVRYRYRCRVIGRGENDEMRVACRRGTRVIKWRTF